jgi:hypothetical protein
MSFSLDAFERTRPFLFHLTASHNLDRIRKQRKLFSAIALMRDAGQEVWGNKKRSGHLSVEIGGQLVVIRDQDPLYEGNVDLQGGWTFSTLIKALNNQVFFWPGTKEGPISYGVRHVERYRDEKPVLLRLPFSQLVSENKSRPPFFCKYNSGAPRCSGGTGSPRGPNTFVNANDATFTPGKVVEVVFREQISLPEITEYSSSLSNSWNRLYG